MEDNINSEDDLLTDFTGALCDLAMSSRGAANRRELASVQPAQKCCASALCGAGSASRRARWR